MTDPQTPPRPSLLPLAAPAHRQPFQIGLYGFGERTTDPETGQLPGEQKVLDDYLEQARLADEVGLDVFALGEHHRADFAVSSPPVVLAAIAGQTRRIRLASTSTVLSSDDPVRVFQQFATLDVVSRGRAEIYAGRGSYVESFPLFGHDLEEYSELYAEKLELLVRLRDEYPLTWSGRFRPELEAAEVHPRPLQRPMPIWVSVGGTPGSVVRAATLGLPLALAIIGGATARFAPFIELYREALRRGGRDAEEFPVTIAGLGYVAEQGARERWYPYLAQGMQENFHQRGAGYRMPRAAYEAQATPGGAYLVGDPDELVERILYRHRLFDHQRELIQLGFGGVPQKEVLRAIELLGTKVAPVVRKEIASRQGALAETPA